MKPARNNVMNKVYLGLCCPIHDSFTFLKKGLEDFADFGLGFFPLYFLSCHLYFMWHDLWIFLFRKYWTVFVYLKGEVVGSAKCYKCCIEFTLLNAPTGVNFLGSSKVGLWKADVFWWVCFRDLCATCRWGVQVCWKLSPAFDGISDLT